jgi:hypothetical protein
MLDDLLDVFGRSIATKKLALLQDGEQRDRPFP